LRHLKTALLSEQRLLATVQRFLIEMLKQVWNEDFWAIAENGEPLTEDLKMPPAEGSIATWAVLAQPCVR
jgi:hypothetical protein